ncbi:pantetheine-phosphate adenylyltransferase [Gryllotalpicola ginsengisoli]|uniref:pantetheine-phosphate adenylyltransferase n=1 Tax=Gryllotalpicola ginsengisoli TaxID=444608 RepID=UPI0003B70AEC|nr:pantetheine-phosphate adenylyltransferase [Gryllotalpicola ginsengisoli]
MSRIAVVPGSFDPVTLGHLDVIERAARLFDRVHVLVVHNPDKPSGLFPPEVRAQVIEKAVAEAGLPDSITVGTMGGGLLADYCTRVGASALVKGLRSHTDLVYETPMAIVNEHLAGVDTVFVLPRPQNAQVSSSLVRQVLALGGDVSPYVPSAVLGQVRQQP